MFHPQSNTVTLGIYTCNNKKPRFVAKADAIKINKHTLRFTFTKRGLGRPGHYQFWGQTATDTDQGFVIADRLPRHKNLVNHLHYR